jgi:hypothetical protein
MKNKGKENVVENFVDNKVSQWYYDISSYQQEKRVILLLLRMEIRSPRGSKT